MTPDQMLPSDYVRQLTRPYSTTEHVTQPTPDGHGRWFTTRRTHTVHHASLLNQLDRAITGASSVADEDAGRSTFASKPAARVEAIDVLAMIDRESLQLAVDLELEEPPRTKTRVIPLPLVDRLAKIGGALGDKDNQAVKRWWVAARITTQWESRPFHPKGAPCPKCWAVDTLRVVLSEEVARCTDCSEVWDGPAFRVLAQHVRWCTDHEVTKPRHWGIDTEGELVECVECLAFRDSYTEWKLASHTGRVDVEARRSA